MRTVTCVGSQRLIPCGLETLFYSSKSIQPRPNDVLDYDEEMLRLRSRLGPSLVFLCFTLAVGAQTRTVSDAEVMRVHRSAILIDGHNDVTSRTVDGLDISGPVQGTHTDVPRMKQGGMGAQFFAAYVSTSYIEKHQSAHRALQMIDTIRRDIAGRSPQAFDFVTTASGIEQARRQGKIGALIGIEGGHAIEEDLRLLRTFYDLGARYMTLTHTDDLSWAGSSGSKDNKGLNDFGHKVVGEMNRLGMLVDISHVSDKTFWDVIEASSAPVFASHSAARAISNIPRNMTDEMIRAVAKKGGVVMINLGCEFLSQKSADSSPFGNPALAAKLREETAGISDPSQRRAVREKMMEDMGLKTMPATIDDVAAQIDHMKDVAGVEVIGLGSDFDGVGCVPKGLEDVSKWPNLTRKLLEKGYSDAQIRMIYGGNFLRFMRSAEQIAATSAVSRSAP